MGSIYRRKRPIVPLYAIVPLITIVVVNFAVYFGADILSSSWKHYDFTMAMDRAVPVIPEFIVVYLGCYIFWVVNYVVIVRLGEVYCARFTTADILSRLVCAVFYLVIPTTNIRPVLSGNGGWVTLLQWVYDTDAPTRLFPSIHCLVSWFCFIGIRGQKSIPKVYRVFSCLCALLICVSTQFTKQHYVVDVIGGILLAEGAYWLSFHTQLYKYPKKIFDTLNNKFFSKEIPVCEKEREV